MINAQEWLDEKYPCECSKRDDYFHNLIIHEENCPRKNLRELNLWNLNLEGDLDLAGFDNLEKIYIANNPNLKEVNKPWPTTKIIYKTSQEWLDRNYSDKNKIKEIVFNSDDWEIEQKSELTIDNYPSLEKINTEYTWDKGISKINKVTIANCPQLEEVNINKFEDNQELILENVPNLKQLSCLENKLTILNLANCLQLEILGCSLNNLTSLDLTNYSNLKRIHCSGNLLTEIKLPLQIDKLETLEMNSNNFPTQGLTFLSHLVNLKNLSLGTGKYLIEKVEKRLNQGIYNHFTGSLEPLKNLTKLEDLEMAGTDLDSGLEHLPKSLKKFKCSTYQRPEAKIGKIEEELWLYGWNLNAWKEAHPKLMGKNKLDISYKDKPLETIATIPPTLVNQEKEHETYDLKEINYQEITLRDKRPFPWEVEQDELVHKELPIKLYSIEKDQVEWTKDNPNIQNYAILSYVWGQPGKAENTIWNTQYKGKLNPAGYKSLYKAIQTCKLLGINYLWMDQLCIDQTNPEEKNQEVPKMGQYYGNATVTLIPINTSTKDENIKNKKELAIETLKKIINSQWFNRSWTFQEGWLSKNTVFMFDDKLIDGRTIAQTWIIKQTNDFRNGSTDDWDLNQEPRKLATPVGWTYCKNGRHSKDKTIMGIGEALQAIKERGRSIPLDGIYSILGLLPYGEKIKPKYKEWEDKYTKEELDEALLELMKVAIQEGYYEEPFTWLDSRRNNPDKWLIPPINEKGSTSIEKTIKINSPKNVELAKNGVKLVGSRHEINRFPALGSQEHPIDKDTHCLWVNIKVNGEENNLLLRGVKETVEKIRPGDILVIPDREQWKIKDDESKWFVDEKFVMLIPKEDSSNCSIDVVLCSSWVDGRYQKIPFLNLEEKNLFIDMVNKKIIELEPIQNQQPQIIQPNLPNFQNK